MSVAILPDPYLFCFWLGLFIHAETLTFACSSAAATTQMDKATGSIILAQIKKFYQIINMQLEDGLG